MITAIVLNKNGGETLLKCLSSLTWCDEVIVADDGSSDDSVKLATKLGARVLHLRPTKSYAEKRNQALDAVRDGWVLFVDHDEVVTPALRDALQQELISPRFDGYFIDRRDIFLGKQLQYGEIAKISILRLAKKGAGTWERVVHEHWNVQGKVGHLTGGYLLHTPHPTLASFFDKLNEYTELEVAERLRERPPSRAMVTFQLCTYPIGKFLQNAVWRMGFLDGIPGLIEAYWMSLHSLMVRIKLLEALPKGEATTNGMLSSLYRILLLTAVGLIPVGQFERFEFHLGTALYVHEVVLALLVGVFVLSEWKGILKWMRHSSLAQSVGILLAWIALSIVVNLHQPASIVVSGLYEARLMLYLASVGVVAALVHKQVVLAVHLRWVLVAAITAVAVLGLLQYVFIPDTRFLMSLGWDNHYLRLISTLFDPGFTGALLAVGALLASMRSGKKHVFLWALCAGALLLTYSRASFLAYGIGTLSVFFWKRDKRALLFLLLFGVAIPFLPRPRSEGTRLERTASIVARVDTFQASTSRRDLLHTLIGYGWYHQKQTRTRQMDDYIVPSHNSAPENSLLFIYDSLGLIGEGLFTLVGVKLLQATHWDREVMIIGGALVVHSLFSNTLFYPFVMLTLVVLMGCRLRESL